ncbi:MAG: metallophosphoesterase [Prevotellaceae bacterium]|jgi:3',5'-cyclic AMP phosphodiesterase CpdA|nr:metallophosphoesterase [Prevotellaceae bacterium]
MKVRFLLTAALAVFFSFSPALARDKGTKLRFAFATDVHMNAGYTENRLERFKLALSKIKEENVDFIVFGGDLNDVSSAENYHDRETSEKLFEVFKKTVEATGLEYYPAIGNHDRFFDGCTDCDGAEMYERFFGKSYRTFEKAGVRFFILNSVQKRKGASGYFVGEEQLEWLRNELASVPASTPVVVSTHVPVYSMYYPVVEGRYAFLDVIANYRELLDAFKAHNLRLVLQGHQHLHEELLLQDVNYVTGGAVCANWWKGEHHGTKEGFLVVDVDENNQFSWSYIIVNC